MAPKTTPTTDPIAGLGLPGGATPPSQAGGTSGGAAPSIIGGLPAGYQQPTHTIDTGGGHPGMAFIPGPETPYDTQALSSGAPGTATSAGGTFYTDGTEWAPLNDPSTVPTLQSELVQAGLLTKANVRVGVWDATSAAAYKVALGFANASGLTINDALGVLIQNTKLGSTSSAGTSSAPGPFAMTDPATVQSAFRNAAESLTGQDLSTQQQSAFDAYFQSQERAAHAAEASATTSGALNAPGAPDASATAEAYIRQNDPSQVMAYGMASRANDFQNLLKSATGM